MIPVGNPKAEYDALQGEIDSAIRGVFERGRFILGEEVGRFEREFAEHMGTKYAVGVANGTDAIALALTASGVGPGDEVITTPLTAVYTSLAISMTGATPIFADIDPETYNIDPAAVARKVGPRTKAIVPVHLYGHPADLDPLMEVARERHLTVVEDAAQAHGALYKGRRVGSIGIAGCFSLYPTKNLGGYGDGGIVATNSPEISDRLRLLGNGGQADRYHHVIKGRNSRLDELQAAILRVKLRHLDAWNTRRREIAALYRRGLAGLPVQLPVERGYGTHVYHLYAARATARDALREHLTRCAVLSEIHYPRLVPLHEAYGPVTRSSTADLPVATEVASSILSLPMFPFLSREDVAQVIRGIQTFYEGRPVMPSASRMSDR